MISKKYTFLNVGNQASFLGNIRNAVDVANAGAGYGWTIDRYNSGDDGELLLHSNGSYGNQNLYYSIKLRVPDSGVSNIHICGQTGYDSGANYDTQPGKFTVNVAGLGDQWNGTVGNYPSNYVKSPVTKQIVFVNKQFIMVFWRQDDTLLSPPGTTYPLWCRFFIGAMDSFFPTTETLLNWVDEVTWGRYGWTSSMFCGGQKHIPYYQSGWPTRPKPTTGLLWKQPYDASPVNKELYWSSESWASTVTRWFSTINHYDNWCYYVYSSGNYYYTGRDVSAFRNGGGFYTDSTRFNVSVVKHFLHRPVVWFYEYLNASNVYLHPLCYLPYQAIRMSNILKGDDVISYGTRNFSVYPDCRDGVNFGCALEFIEG